MIFLKGLLACLLMALFTSSCTAQLKEGEVLSVVDTLRVPNDLYQELGSLQFQRNSFSGLDFSANAYLQYGFFHDSIYLEKELPIEHKMNERIIEVYRQKNELYVLLVKNKSTSEGVKQLYGIRIYDLNLLKNDFSLDFNQNVTLVPGWFNYPPLRLNDSLLMLHGHVNGNWDHYFNNPMELVINVKTGEYSNDFPVLEQANVDQYASYVRNHLARMRLSETELVYSVPIDDKLYVYGLGGSFRKAISLGNAKAASFEILEEPENFNEMMLNMKAMPYYSFFGLFNGSYLYRVFEEENRQGVKVKPRHKRPWELHLMNLDKDKTNVLEFTGGEYSPTVRSSENFLILQKIEEDSDYTDFIFYSCLF